jgi:hypothetical protein
MADGMSVTAGVVGPCLWSPCRCARDAEAQPLKRNVEATRRVDKAILCGFVFDCNRVECGHVECGRVECGRVECGRVECDVFLSSISEEAYVLDVSEDCICTACASAKLTYRFCDSKACLSRLSRRNTITRKSSQLRIVAMLDGPSGTDKHPKSG